MTGPTKISRLPEAVAAHCLSFLDSADHSVCARLCQWFRGVALLSAGFPETVRILSPQHTATASAALVRMRPRRLLEICVDGTGSPTTTGAVGRLLAKQPHVRHLVLATKRSASSLDHQVSIEMNRAYGAAPDAVNGGSGDGENVEKLAACERLDVRASVVGWYGWFPALLSRLPCLTRFECYEFPARLGYLLCDGAPQLTALRIERQDFVQRQMADKGWTGTNGRFVHELLSSLGRMRSLALPYATVYLTDLSVAADRLESLEACNLLPSDATYPEAPSTFVMSRLKRLTTSMPERSAAELLGCMPHVCSGQLSFDIISDDDWTSFLTASLASKRYENDTTSGATGGGGGGGGGDGKRDSDETGATADEKSCGSGDGDGNDGGVSDGNGDDENAGVNIVWRFYSDRDESEIPTFATDVCRAMRKLHTFAASVHDFDSSVSDAMRLGIEAYLKEMRDADAAIAVTAVVATTSGTAAPSS
jgi:hypothetical protein